MNRVIALAVAAALPWFGGCVSSGGSRADGQAPLADGFRVPEGARVVGRVVPELQSFFYATDLSETHRSWTVTLAISGDARRVYAALRGQATQAGYPGMQDASSACEETPERSLRSGVSGSRAQLTSCSGQGAPKKAELVNGGRSFRVELARCTRCRPQVGIGRITYDAGPGTGSTMRVRQRPVMRNRGWSDPHTWLTLPGTTVVRSGLFFGCQLNQLVAVSVNADPEAVWRSAIDNSLTVQGEVSTMADGHEVREAVAADGSDRQLLILDFGTHPRPTLYMSLCEG